MNTEDKPRYLLDSVGRDLSNSQSEMIGSCRNVNKIQKNPQALKSTDFFKDDNEGNNILETGINKGKNSVWEDVSSLGNLECAENGDVNFDEFRTLSKRWRSAFPIDWLVEDETTIYSSPCLLLVCVCLPGPPRNTSSSAPRSLQHLLATRALLHHDLFSRCERMRLSQQRDRNAALSQCLSKSAVPATR
ncbi:hypothetical protein O6H91_05G095900 [Diphasiastrum complanatum]|uniref:Uncharacterized protein n=1 Tax=Diphasiastrum complanatum TaxID=34168 RepID=A0ACC2DRA5_DIPCM|nr:hypothetical protein O6H91_05G095900 [Diphasiastrum complanatum]